MGSYKIVAGDTLGNLARKYNTTTQALQKLNNISNPNRIYAGRSINIPGYGQTPAPAPVQAAPSPAPASPVPTPAPAPAPQTLDQWLAGDSTYNQQIADYNKTKADHDAQYTQQVQNTNRDYDTTNRALQQQAVVDRNTQLNDYAGRGIVNSGVYGQALAKYNGDLNTKVQNLAQGQQDQLNNYSNDNTNFGRQLQLQQDTAKADAVRRRAQQFGI